MERHLSILSSTDLAVLDRYKGHGHLHLRAPLAPENQNKHREIAQVRLSDGSRVLPMDVVGSGLFGELPLYSFVGLVEIPQFSHDFWRRKLQERQGETYLVTQYEKHWRAAESLHLLIDRREGVTLTRAWKKHPALGQGPYWGTINVGNKHIFEPLLLMKAVDFLKRSEANPEPLQVLTAAFREGNSVDELETASLAQAGCVLHDDSQSTLNTNLLIRSLAMEEIKRITTGQSIPGIYLHVHMAHEQELRPQSLASSGLLSQISDAELKTIALRNVAVMKAAKNPTTLGKPVSVDTVYEGLLNAIPKVLEIAGNNGSINDAKQVVQNFVRQRK